MDYADLTDRTEETVRRLCAFAGLEVDQRLQDRVRGELPLSRYTQTAPDPEKWRRNEAEILPLMEPGHDAQVLATWERCRAAAETP